jgi:hypothetical protein
MPVHDHTEKLHGARHRRLTVHSHALFVHQYALAHVHQLSCRHMEDQKWQ